MNQQKLSALQDKISACNKCERLREVTPWPLAHICFSEHPKIMTIGRNPGLEHKYGHIQLNELNEFYHDKWLISEYGSYLQKIFTEEFVKENIFACNICKCSTPKNAKLMDAEINHCLPFLYEQIKLVKPEIILIFGGEAANAVLDVSWTYLKPVKYKDTKALVCRHPAYFLYTRNVELEQEQAKALLTIKAFVETKNS